MKHRPKFKKVCLNFALCLWASLLPILAPASPGDKDETLSGFRDLRSQNQKRLEEVDQKIRRSLDEQLNPQFVVNPSVKELEDLKNQRQELLARQQFLDRLILQVDSRYRGRDLRRFLQERLSEMAQVDLMSTDSSNNSLWKQMTYLGQALRDLPERDENLVQFVSGYLAASNFKEPLKPEQYLKSRNFFNGRTSVAGAPLKPEDVGDAVERRLEQIDRTSQKSQQ